MRQTLSSFIQGRMTALKIKNQPQLKGLLSARGADVSINAISLWMTGRRVPRPGHLAALLDVLNVHGDERTAALVLAHERQVEIDGADDQGEAGDASTAAGS